MDLRQVAAETVEIVARGTYVSGSGRRAELRAAIASAVGGTALYTPEACARLARSGGGAPAARPRIEVTAETTAVAGRRLVEREREPRVAALNFASAKNAGGGFLGGAKAQEEDLARCSALYECLITQPGYYAANRATRSMLYTDHLIYSPDVPFFHDDELALLDEPFALSILTSPAPNAGEFFAHRQGTRADVRSTLERRTRHVLAIAREHGHRCLVLGAWGCGVFRNDPHEVAAVFAEALEDATFTGAFDRVVFAIHARPSERANLDAFLTRFTRQ
jgi:uncharacterized protein (TIGR02452 family)